MRASKHWLIHHFEAIRSAVLDLKFNFPDPRFEFPDPSEKFPVPLRREFVCNML
jgi:hypothetical protein